MKIAPTLAKDKLETAISAVSTISWLFAKDLNSDFTRTRKRLASFLLSDLQTVTTSISFMVISSYFDADKFVFMLLQHVEV